MSATLLRELPHIQTRTSNGMLCTVKCVDRLCCVSVSVYIHVPCVCMILCEYACVLHVSESVIACLAVCVCVGVGVCVCMCGY